MIKILSQGVFQITEGSKTRNNLKMNEWRKAIRSPMSYTVSNSTLRIQTTFVFVIIFCGLFVLFILYLFVSNSPSGRYETYERDNIFIHSHHRSHCKSLQVYNHSYPLTLPEASRGSIKYRIAVISDLDKESKSKLYPNQWISYLLKGDLIYYPDDDVIQVKWDKSKTVLSSSIAEDNRAMELSELVVFNGHLFSCDDRTGMIYRIRSNELLVPWVILSDGDGNESKGFKCEWATVKDESLYVGSLGKEWTDIYGNVINFNPQWVKKISLTGEVEHIDWRHNYIAMMSSINIHDPGYVIHESVAWSDVHRKWFFLPRRVSSEIYTEKGDETKGSNIIITADENFKKFEHLKIGSIKPTRGFSSFKFLPNTQHRIIVAIKSEETSGILASYITAFTLTGKTLLNEQRIGDEKIKFEGIEFI